MMWPMKLRHELTYDAPVAEVFAMLSDPAFRDQLAIATEAVSSNASVSVEGDTTTVLIDQIQPVRGVPGFAKKIAGDSTHAIQRETWTGGTSASLTIETPGKPTSISGTVALDDRGGRTVQVYDLDVLASVPLIGGRLEKLVVELTAAGFEKEQAVGTAWLKGGR
ncbi:MAG: hypothetical protein JWR35_2297 [Marmoricola sp.]|jgi:uncharacterized protein YndB with AHSA1/START domain|nr:hypothetical protein [Marmoricola sp.]